MSHARMLKLLAAGALVVAAAGCAPLPPGRVVYVEYATYAPPPLQYEVIGVAPGPGYLWVAGYWNWTGVEYVWVSGSWVVPPPGRRVWVAPAWQQHRGRGWYMRRGRWR